jgi:hypothetical protein
VVRRRLFVVFIALVSCIAVLPAGSGAATLTPSDNTGAIQTLEIRAADYSFDAPATIPAGRTRVVLHNTATDEPHQASLVRLNDGVSTADFVAGLAQSFDAAAAKGTFVGGPNGAGPGHESGVVVDLQEGQYAVLCLIPSPDGQPHVVKGMTRDLTVTAPSGKTKAKAKKLATLTLSEYQFKVPKQLGKGAVEVVNKGKEPHEAVIGKLPPGKKVADIIDWVTPVFVPAPGPQPYEDLAGTTPISPGGRVRLDTKLPKGTYLLLCFIPDPSGTAHLKLGMIHPFSV